jgi:glycosyltransferase involved in cell wall biosynthesis
MGNDKIKHSIVIISYNQERYILKAIKSIYDQEIPPYELIILDDCSNDSTIKIAREYITKNPTIFQCKIIVNEHNLGIPMNMKKAAEVSSGNVLSLLAADDEWLSNGTRCVINGIEKNNLNPDKDDFVCFSPTLSMNIDGSNQISSGYKIYRNSPLQTMVRKCAPFGKIGFSRSVMIGIDYPSDIGLWADWVWDVSICNRAKKYYQIKEHCFIHYGEIGVSSTTNSHEIDQSYWKASKYLLDNYKDKINLLDRLYLVGEKYYSQWKIYGGIFNCGISILLTCINLANSGGGASFNSLLSRFIPRKVFTIIRTIKK